MSVSKSNDFIVVGGGWFGSFYVRQLLRGAERIGVGRIHVVDRDSNCQVAREFSSQDRLIFHIQDWMDFLKPYLDHQVEKVRCGEPTTDQYVPPTLAPHILLELFLEKAKEDSPSLRFEAKPFTDSIGTPVDMALPAGTRALSFATWTCPHSCIEPPTCPHTKGAKSWDMKRYLAEKIKDNLHVFQCRHYAMGVGTIPMADIVDEYLKFETAVRSPGTHRLAMATVSSCHGLVGLVEVHHA